MKDPIAQVEIKDVKSGSILKSCPKTGEPYWQEQEPQNKETKHVIPSTN